MRRRTFRQLRAAAESQFHHHVYVVLLDARAGKLRKAKISNPKRDPDKPSVYVGMSGLTPAERFQNHKAGMKAARVVQRHGLRLLPELYEIYNPMPFEAAATMERELAEDLRAQGYTVFGGT
jgi:hypothetical protein